MTTASTNRSDMIRVEGLTKRFERVTAVDDVDLSVPATEVVGLVGINGAGKTTLLRMLAGILEPTRGTITIAGHPVAAGTVEARRALSFVPDTPTLFEPLTVLEHLLFVAELYRVSDPQPAIDALLDEFELADKRHTPAGSLSRGMRQKVSICCAFLHDPSVLLLDEPLTGLDPLGRKRICDAITARASQGTAVIISSHQLEIIERLSERFIIIHEGRVRLSGTLEEVRQGMGSLEDVFLQATEETES